MQDHEQISGKKIHAPDGFAFEGENLVPVCLPESSNDPALVLLHALEEIGSIFPDTSKAVALIETSLDMAGDQRGADALKRLTEKLKGTSAGEAVRRVIFGEAESLKVAAERAGVSTSAIFYQQQTIEKRLGLKIQVAESPAKEIPAGG
jgi:hypothetical protein